MNNAQLQGCDAILEQLLSDARFEPHFQHIGTIQRKLKARQYATVQEVYTECCYIWQKCQSLDPKGQEVGKLLQIKLQHLWAQILPDGRILQERSEEQQRDEHHRPARYRRLADLQSDEKASVQPLQGLNWAPNTISSILKSAEDGLAVIRRHMQTIIAALRKELKLSDGASAGSTHAAKLSDSMGAELDCTLQQVEQLMPPTTPPPTVLFVGEERVGKSFTLGSTIEHLVEQTLAVPAWETKCSHAGLCTARLGTQRADDAGGSSGGGADSALADDLLRFDGAEMGTPGTATTDLEAADVGWSTTWSGRSCNVIPVVYRLGTDPALGVKVVVHYHTEVYVRQRLTLLLNDGDTGADADDMAAEISMVALEEEVCAMAGAANSVQDMKQAAKTIQQHGLTLPSSYKHLLGQSKTYDLGPLQAVRSGAAVRKVLFELMSARYGLYEVVEVLVPCQQAVTLVDTAGLTSLASLGFERTAQMLRNESYAMVVMVQGDGVPSSDVTLSLQKAKVFSKFDSKRQILPPPPRFLVVRNYGKDPVSLPGPTAEAALAHFQQVDGRASYHKAMERSTAFLRISKAVRLRIVNNSAVCGLFNLDADVPELLRGCTEINSGFRLHSMWGRVQEGLDAWSAEHRRLQLMFVMAKVIAPLLSLCMRIGSIGDAGDVEDRSKLMAGQKCLRQLASTELQDLLDKTLSQAQHVSTSDSTAAAACMKELTRLAAKCTPKAARFRVEERERLAPYKKKGCRALGTDLKSNDLTATLLPEYLLEPLYNGAPDILKGYLEEAGHSHIQSMLEMVQDFIAKHISPVLSGTDKRLITPYMLLLETGLHQVEMTAKDEVQRCVEGTSATGDLTRQYLHEAMGQDLQDLGRLLGKTVEKKNEILQELVPIIASKLVHVMVGDVFQKRLPDIFHHARGTVKATWEKARAFVEDVCGALTTEEVQARLQRHPLFGTAGYASTLCAMILHDAKQVDGLLDGVAPAALGMVETLMTEAQNLDVAIRELEVHEPPCESVTETAGSMAGTAGASCSNAQEASSRRRAALRVKTRCLVCKVREEDSSCVFVSAAQGWSNAVAKEISGDRDIVDSAAGPKLCMTCYQGMYRLNRKGTLNLESIAAYRLKHADRMHTTEGTDGIGKVKDASLAGAAAGGKAKLENRDVPTDGTDMETDSHASRHFPTLDIPATGPPTNETRDQTAMPPGPSHTNVDSRKASRSEAPSRGEGSVRPSAGRRVEVDGQGASKRQKLDTVDSTADTVNLTAAGRSSHHGSPPDSRHAAPAGAQQLQPGRGRGRSPAKGVEPPATSSAALREPDVEASMNGLPKCPGMASSSWAPGEAPAASAGTLRAQVNPAIGTQSGTARPRHPAGGAQLHATAGSPVKHARGQTMEEAAVQQKPHTEFTSSTGEERLASDEDGASEGSISDEESDDEYRGCRASKRKSKAAGRQGVRQKAAASKEGSEKPTAQEFLLVLPWLGPNRPSAVNRDKYQAARKLVTAAYRSLDASQQAKSFGFVIEKVFGKLDKHPNIVKGQRFSAYEAHVPDSAAWHDHKDGRPPSGTLRPVIRALRGVEARKLIDEASAIWEAHAQDARGTNTGVRHDTSGMEAEHRAGSKRPRAAADSSHGAAVDIDELDGQGSTKRARAAPVVATQPITEGNVVRGAPAGKFLPSQTWLQNKLDELRHPPGKKV